MPGHDAKAPQPAPTTAPTTPAAIPAGTPTSDRFAAETVHHGVTGTTDEPVETVPAEGLAREEQVRLKAYELWDQEGQPDGRADAHWAEAERLLSP